MLCVGQDQKAGRYLGERPDLSRCHDREFQAKAQQYVSPWQLMTTTVVRILPDTLGSGVPQ